MNIDDDCTNPECEKAGRCGGECLKQWDEELDAKKEEE